MKILKIRMPYQESLLVVGGERGGAGVIEKDGDEDERLGRRWLGNADGARGGGGDAERSV